MSKDERKDFYRTIAWGLNRPLFAVYRRVLRMYDDRNHVGKYENLLMFDIVVKVASGFLLL